MRENRYLVVHNNGADLGWTMLVTTQHGRSLMLLDAARIEAEKYVSKNPANKAMILEAVFTIETEYPPVKIRRFK